MGLRFRKSIKIAPGVKFNINKKSVGLTFGKRGAHYTINSKGKKTASVGIPGTGLSYTTSSGGGDSTSSASSPSEASNNGGKKTGCGGWLMIFLIACLVLAVIGFVFSYAWIPGIIAMIYFAVKTPDKKQKFIRVGATGVISLMSLIFLLTSSGNLSDLEVKWDKQEYDINETATLELICTPEGADIKTLSISDNDVAELDYAGGKATVTFKEEGTASVYFTANDSITSDSTKITVVDKEAQKKAEEAKRKEEAEKQAEIEAQQKAEEAAAQAAAEAEAQKQAQAQEPQEEMVWIPASGSKYHSNSSCSGMNNPTQVTKSDAEARGYTPCKRCH